MLPDALGANGTLFGAQEKSLGTVQLEADVLKYCVEDNVSSASRD